MKNAQRGKSPTSSPKHQLKVDDKDIKQQVDATSANSSTAKKDVYVSINFGIYLCKNCARDHKKEFMMHESYVKTLFHEPWDAYQVRQMMNGGNSKFYKFICEYGLNSTETMRDRYESEAAVYYMKRLSCKSVHKDFHEMPPPKSFKDVIGMAKHNMNKIA
jgi:hypothetical protein